MPPEDPHASETLAFIASTGWRLTLYCGACRSPRVTLDGPEIVARFRHQLDRTVGDVCERLVCEDCKDRPGYRKGGWASTMAGVNPEVVTGVENLGEARRLYLEGLLGDGRT